MAPRTIFDTEESLRFGLSCTCESAFPARRPQRARQVTFTQVMGHGMRLRPALSAPSHIYPSIGTWNARASNSFPFSKLWDLVKLLGETAGRTRVATRLCHSSKGRNLRFQHVAPRTERHSFGDIVCVFLTSSRVGGLSSLIRVVLYLVIQDLYG